MSKSKKIVPISSVLDYEVRLGQECKRHTQAMAKLYEAFHMFQKDCPHTNVDYRKGNNVIARVCERCGKIME